jgi:hypothetical protein
MLFNPILKAVISKKTKEKEEIKNKSLKVIV